MADLFIQIEAIGIFCKLIYQLHETGECIICARCQFLAIEQRMRGLP